MKTTGADAENPFYHSASVPVVHITGLPSSAAGKKYLFVLLDNVQKKHHNRGNDALTDNRRYFPESRS